MLRLCIANLDTFRKESFLILKCCRFYWNSFQCLDILDLSTNSFHLLKHCSSYFPEQWDLHFMLQVLLFHLKTFRFSKILYSKILHFNSIMFLKCLFDVRYNFLVLSLCQLRWLIIRFCLFRQGTRLIHYSTLNFNLHFAHYLLYFNLHFTQIPHLNKELKDFPLIFLFYCNYYLF